MARVELKIELRARYCPICRIETQHTVLFQLLPACAGRGNGKKRPDGRADARGSPRPSGRKEPDELVSACAICNPDRFWALRFATVRDAQKLIAEGWTPRLGHSAR